MPDLYGRPLPGEVGYVPPDGMDPSLGVAPNTPPNAGPLRRAFPSKDGLRGTVMNQWSPTIAGTLETTQPPGEVYPPDGALANLQAPPAAPAPAPIIPPAVPAPVPPVAAPQAPPAPPTTPPAPTPAPAAQEAPAAPAGALAGVPPAPVPAPSRATGHPDAPQGAHAGHDFGADLFQRESGGNWGAQNKQGYVGGYQFGTARLADLGVYQPAQGEDVNGNRWGGTLRIPGFDNIRTIADFKASPEAQRAVFGEHVKRIDEEIDRTPGADKFDRDGLRAVAHLGGAGGMRKFVASGGAYNPADANGTSLGNYYAKFSGSGDLPEGLERPTQGTQTVQQGGQADTSRSSALGGLTPPADVTGDLPTSVGRERSKPMMDPQWLALAGGFFSGRNARESFANAAGALGQQQQLDERRNDADASAERSMAVKRAELKAQQQHYQAQREQFAVTTDLNERRLDQGERRTQALIDRYQNPPDSANGTYVDKGAWTNATGESFTVSFNKKDGGYSVNGKPVADGEFSKLGLRPPQYTPSVVGETSAARSGSATLAADSTKDYSETSTGWRTAVEERNQIANTREVLKKEGITGPDVVSRLKRAAVELTGLEIDGVTPGGLSLGKTQLEALSQGQIRGALAGQGAVSEWERKNAAQAFLGLQTNPQAANVLLDWMDTVQQRKLAVRDQWTALGKPAQDAILKTGGFRAWHDEQINKLAEQRGIFAGGAAPATIQQAPGGGFQSKTSSGVGFTFNP